jgi:eukaryotic translation initiation factor 2C
VEVTVYNYFMNHWGIELKESAHLLCLNVGKPNRPTYLPLEVCYNCFFHYSFVQKYLSPYCLCHCKHFNGYQLCNLVSFSRYTKALSTLQRSSLVTKSRKNPSERKLALSDVR